MQPERVDPPRAEPPPASARKRFEELLRARTGRPSHAPRAPPRRQKTAVPARGTAGQPLALAPGAVRLEARKEMDTSARQRASDGAVATGHATGRLEARATELLRAALRTEDRARTELPGSAAGSPARTGGLLGPVAGAPPAPSVAATGGGTAGAPMAAPTSAERVETALALVERIERFVRSGRPSLALTLRGGLPGRLELQRVGPGAIALRLASTRPPSASELGELRQALEARGLWVRSLETRALTASAADACSPCP